MSKKRKRNAIHSGIGDNDDLLVKRPKEENGEETFQYAVRLRGKKRHETMIYPEIPFEYGIHYTGQTLETYNEKPYKFGIHAHPEKTIAYRIQEDKELPVKRMWEARACFEATVWRMNMKYALKWSGKKAYQARNTVEYAVSWKASVVSKSISDARSFFTSQNGQFIGYGDSTTWKRHSSGYVYDYSNVGRFSGIIAKHYYDLTDYEAEFDFKTVLATNDQHVGGNDDDIVGLIFKAKDNKNFYMMLWERHNRVKGSWRAPDNLEGFNMLTSGESAWENRVEADNCKSSIYMSDSQWDDYVNNRGWRLKHRRIYKVTNGVMRRVDTTPSSGTPGYDSSVKDLGNGKGWDLNELHTIKVNSIGKRVQIFIRDNGVWSKIFDFETDWEKGSFGMVNVSQAVQFHRIEVKEKKIIQGRIPETGWHTSNQATKTLGTGYNYCITQAKQKANALKASIPTVDTNTIDFIWIAGSLKDSTKGSITNPIGESTNIVVTAGTHTAYENISGRVPQTGWFEFDGIGSRIHAQNAMEYIKSKDSVAAQSNVTITSIVGEVWDDPQYPVPTGTVIVTSLAGQIIAKNNNPTDAGKTYSKCYVRCGIVEVTPDHRNYETGLMVWSDIANVFKKDYAEFFNRIEYINKKATYELLKPIKKDPPKPPPKEESEAGCVIEEPKPPAPDEPIIECWDDFHFDGKKLIMWSCEFPVETTTKLFEDQVYAYRGWMTFNPLASFTPNKWTKYTLIPIEAAIDPTYDEIKWAGWETYKNAPPGTKVLIRTKEWYKAIFPADIINSGIVNSEENIIANIPPAPEHYVHPEKTDERMPDRYEVIHYLLYAWDNHPDVVMWFAANPNLTTENVHRNPESLAKEGLMGMPIILTSNHNDQIVIHCKEDPRYIPWSSGKYIGYGKVNGKRPFFGDGAGKADMVNVSTEVVFFPNNLVRETLQGPFIDIYDPEFPEEPRVKYRLHSDNKLVDFYSDYMDAYIWYTDWYSKWVEDITTYTATMKEIIHIANPLELDPTDPTVSEDYQPDNTMIEKIEVTSSNPFVKLWIEEDRGKMRGLLGTYYHRDKYDPTQKYYLGEKKYSQLDFQEDTPSQSSNPNYNDPYYEGSLCFNWGYNSPKDLPSSNDFAVSWNGYLYAPESGIYRFKATVNDGFRLWVRDKQIIDKWHVTGNPDYFPDYEASIYLEGGKWHPIRIHYFDHIGQALMRLHWSIPGKGYQRISPHYLTPYLGYRLFAQVKQARPLPWNPMIHNGYYYHEDREYYLYAQKVVHKKTPDVFHEIQISPRPQQGSAIIVRDNEGNNLRKVTFYDENWNLTLENKEEFHGNGYAKYYLQYKGVDKQTLKVKVNGKTLMNHDYIFHEEESAIEFMEELHMTDQIEIRYKLLYSYCIDMNADIVDGFVNKDVAKIRLHNNYDPKKMVNMEIIYEAAKDTPFYRATEVVFNPLLNHNHSGFLYITEQQEQAVKEIMVHLSDKTLSNSGLEKVLVTVKVIDSYGNPCPNKRVQIFRDDVLVFEGNTNMAGEVYLYDQPVPTDELVSVYRIHCEDIIQEVLLNYYVDQQLKRYYLDIMAEKLTVMAGVEDDATIQVTLRDHHWNPVGTGYTVKVEYRNTHGEKKTETLVTDAYGQVHLRISGLEERHGNIMVKVSYDMGFEETANYVYIKVIGG